MSRRTHVARNIALGASSASLAVGLAACSNGPSAKTSTHTTVPGPVSVRQQLQQFSTASRKVSVEMEVSFEVDKALSVFLGTGTLAASQSEWDITALPINVTNPTFAVKVLEYGGHAYATDQAFQVALPKIAWIDLVGSTKVLHNSALEDLTVSPRAGAAIATASGVSFHKTTMGNISGIREQGYGATISAAAAVHALTAAGLPSIDVQLAAGVFARRTLTLDAYLDEAGHLGAFGWSCSTSGSTGGISVLYYVSTRTPVLEPAPPTGEVKTFAQYLGAATSHAKE